MSTWYGAQPMKQRSRNLVRQKTLLQILRKESMIRKLYAVMLIISFDLLINLYINPPGLLALTYFCSILIL